MPKSALARASSTLRMMSRKRGKSSPWLEEGEVAFAGDIVEEVLEGVADAEVGRDEVAGLHPAEDPGDGAEVGHGALSGGAGVFALGGAGADAGVFELGDGGGLFEVGEDFGVVDDVLLVEGEGGGGELVEGGLPGGEDFAGEVGLAGWDAGPLRLRFRDDN